MCSLELDYRKCRFITEIELFLLLLSECPKGKKPVIVNNRYECPDHPPCGEPPNCVVGRKGPGCSQPDVQPCSGEV